MPRYHARITGPDYDAMADLVRKYKVMVARHSVEQVANGYCVDGHASGAQIRALESAGYTVERLEDTDKASKARQKETRKVTELAVSAEALSVATSNAYLNVAEVEAALAAIAAAPNKAFTKLIKLPKKTWEKRVCNSLRIGKGTGQDRAGIFLLGGVHAREWGSPDILIHFMQLLTDAYRTNTGITIGHKKFSAAQIKAIVETKDIYVFPQANPDGRNYSMVTEPMWRKNRRPAPSGHSESQCVGVDLNRNYDFLWDFPTYFHPDCPIANSVDPCDHDVYIGPKAASETETKNVIWMFDSFPNIHYFVDIHSYSEVILYNWGDDVNQATKPAMNFRNASFDGKRGIANDTVYREYFAAADRKIAVGLANKMRDAIKAVRGRTYRTEQAMSLYPTAGTSDDYAFSRHLVDSTKTKVYSYTIEWGSPSNPTPFHPPYPEMKKIIDEVTAGLLAFCVAAT